MNYHNITKDDMLNGDGLRVVLWVSGCTHCCDGCQNPETWEVASGIEFDEAAETELFEALAQEHISGITFSGGHPLENGNISEVYNLCKEKNVKIIYFSISKLFLRVKQKPCHKDFFRIYCS